LDGDYPRLGPLTIGRRGGTKIRLMLKRTHKTNIRLAERKVVKTMSPAQGGFLGLGELRKSSSELDLIS